MHELLVTSVGSAILVGAAGWLARTWVKERLTASIRVETEKKLAKLSSEIEAANQKISHLSSVGAAANSQVEAALLEHRISAVRTVWESIQRWQQASVASMMVSLLSDEWLEENSTDPGTKSTFEQVLKGLDVPDFMKKQNETELVRPFLSESVWALYSAYHSFLSSRLGRAQLLTISELNHADLVKRSSERDLVAASAPAEILKLYDQSAYSATEPYLRFLREKLLEEIREFLSGHRAGTQALKDAAEITRAAEELTRESSPDRKHMQGAKNA